MTNFVFRSRRRLRALLKDRSVALIGALAGGLMLAPMLVAINAIQSGAAASRLARDRIAALVAGLPRSCADGPSGGLAFQAISAQNAALQGWQMQGFWWLVISINAALVALVAGVVAALLYDRARRRAQANIDEIRRTAQAADASRSRFLSSAGHDLRQPLQAATLFVSALERNLEDSRLKSLIDGVRSSLMSLERMCKGLLDIAKLDAGVVSAERSDFHIGEILNGLQMEFAVMAMSKGLKFEVVSTPAMVFTDRVLFESMIRNLVANAIKYTVQGRVVVACHGTGPEVLVEVLDTGPGIAEEELNVIFREFQRASNVPRGSEGLGLGLAIVRRLAELLGITVTVQSVEGIGSTFTLAVPQSSRLVAAQTPSAPRMQLDANAPPPHLLLVDDDPMVRSAFAQEFRSRGLIVSEYPGVRPLLDHYQSESTPAFDVAVIDFDLGSDMNGMQLLDHLAAEYGAAYPALIVTGMSDPAMIKELRDSGYPWFGKPVDSEMLLEAVLGLVNDARLVQACDEADESIVQLD